MDEQRTPETVINCVFHHMYLMVSRYISWFILGIGSIIIVCIYVCYFTLCGFYSFMFNNYHLGLFIFLFVLFYLCVYICVYTQKIVMCFVSFVLYSSYDIGMNMYIYTFICFFIFIF
jgi:hypothetical protein